MSQPLYPNSATPPPRHPVDTPSVLSHPLHRLLSSSIVSRVQNFGLWLSGCDRRQTTNSPWKHSPVQIGRCRYLASSFDCEREKHKRRDFDIHCHVVRICYWFKLSHLLHGAQSSVIIYFVHIWQLLLLRRHLSVIIYCVYVYTHVHIC